MKNSALPHELLMLGIGGAGMAPLGIYLAEAGYAVTGYDDHLPGPVRDLLIKHGIRIWERDVLPADTEAVIYSNAIPNDHILKDQARGRDLLLLSRGVTLAHILSDKKLLAVVGSHGKTTTTGMLIHALRSQQFEFGYLLGGFFKGSDLSPAHYSGASEWVISEIDESNASLEYFHPEATVALNLDWDHPYQYPTEADLIAAFQRLFSRIRTAVWVPDTDATLLRLAHSSKIPHCFTFGHKGEYEGRRVSRVQSGNLLRLKGRFPEAEIALPSVGAFNAFNALAALAATDFLTGLTAQRDILKKFSGIRCRQEWLYQRPDLDILEDYAHHPTEIEVLLQFAREAFPHRKIVAVFQPHRYTRTLQYRKAFAQRLSVASHIILMEVYPAYEPPIPDAHAKSIFEAFDPELRKKVTLVAPGTSVAQAIETHLDTSAVVLFIGAGDIDAHARAWAAALRYPWDSAQQWMHFIRSRVSRETQIRIQEPLANKTTLGVGGKARCYAEPGNRGDLSYILQSASLFGLKVFYLGKGSNLLVPDEGVDGIVIRLNHANWRQIENLADGQRLWCGAGVRLRELSEYALRKGLAGFEFLEGIPGSVGGALRMNAGAMGDCMFNRVEAVELMSPNGKRYRMDKTQLTVDYRECRELKEALALGVILKGSQRDTAEQILKRIKEMAAERKSKQPSERSAGCIFKNPVGESAGAIIDRLGLKGERVEAAEISAVHANFIVNRGGATYDDVLRLIQRIRTTVKERCGLVLEPELQLMGKYWEEVFDRLSKLNSGVRIQKASRVRL